jgi:hypothetical protein
VVRLMELGRTVRPKRVRARKALLLAPLEDYSTTTRAPTLTRPMRSLMSSLNIRMQP